MKLTGWALLVVAGAAGCATLPAEKPIARATTLPATLPSNPNAFVALEQIEPKLALPKAKPATQPAPLNALELFARARDAQIQNQRYSAINLIEQALQLDPDSVELNIALGRAYMTAGGMNDRAIAAFEKAADISPDDLEIQAELGRAYQSRNNPQKATEHFRLAQLTADYQAGDALASVVDYRLGLLLEDGGYDRAALQCYSRLLDRLAHPGQDARSNPEVVYLMSRPELINEEIGRLQEKLGNLPEALAAYQRVAQESPNDFESQSRVVRVLVRLNRSADAMVLAADLVRGSRANAESIALMREVHEKSGAKDTFADALRRLAKANPDDRAIQFALADTLAGSGQIAQAAELLNPVIDAGHGDPEAVQRLFRLYADRDQVDEAAALIIRVSSTYPNATTELQEMFSDLMRLSRKNALRTTSIQKLQVPPNQTAAKLYWTWRLASVWSHVSVARQSLEQSAAATPVFGPAARDLLNDYLARSDKDLPSRQKSINDLIESVRTRGRVDLAEELSGLFAMASGQVDQAVKHLDAAITAAPEGKPSPELQLEDALAQRKLGNTPRFEQLMWRLLADHSRFTGAYELLMDHYQQGNAETQEWNVLNTWLAADPTNIHARLHLVDALIQLRRADDALAQMRRLFDEHPDDDAVVANLISLLRSANQQQQLMELLEAERVRHPNNRVVVEALVSLYAGANQVADAQRVLAAARAAVANDPDLLYYIANLYHRVDQPDVTEQILQDVLKLDPRNPQAGNDLGYSWADSGKNLDRAEAMIRIAVDAEPDNPSYLDSMGWVLYKRGRFDQALKFLQQASEPLDQADPVVLDHLGDALYRVGREGDARQTWQLSLNGIQENSGRKELQELRLKLATKLRQAQQGQPVNIAPVVETPQNLQQTSTSGQNNGRP